MPSTTSLRSPERGLQSGVLPAGAAARGRGDGRHRRLVEIRLSPRWSASTRYGESAPAPVLFKHFGFTPENVADTVQRCWASNCFADS
jgi:transketolase